MKQFLPTLVLLLGCLSGLLAQSNAVVFRFQHRVGQEPLAIGSTVFALPDGTKALLTRGEFYISEVTLNTTAGNDLPLTNFYMLVNANAPNREYEAGTWPVGGITGLTLHLGVDSAHNHLDPSSYPAGHPLAHHNPSMHWGWTAGYRFMAIEGYLDKNGDGVPETLFQYHNLGNALYETAVLEGMKMAENGTLYIDLTLDYTRLFDKLDLTGNLTQHGSAPPNAAMMKNAATKGFLTIQTASSTTSAAGSDAYLRVSPNPVRHAATLLYDLGETGSVTLICNNTAGQLVYRQDNLPPAGSLPIALENQPPGVYFCGFYRAGQLVVQQRLVKIE